jgi:hypothetical protein
LWLRMAWKSRDCVAGPKRFSLPTPADSAGAWFRGCARDFFSGSRGSADKARERTQHVGSSPQTRRSVPPLSSIARTPRDPSNSIQSRIWTGCSAVVIQSARQLTWVLCPVRATKQPVLTRCPLCGDVERTAAPVRARAEAARQRSLIAVGGLCAAGGQRCAIRSRLVSLSSNLPGDRNTGVDR